MITNKDNKGKEQTAYEFTYTGEEAKKMEKIFFGANNQSSNKNSFIKKIQDFEENHFFIVLFIFLAAIFIGLYILSVVTWNNGKCLLVIPYLSHSTNSSCAGLDGALTNAIYLFVALIIGAIASSFFRKNR